MLVVTKAAAGFWTVDLAVQCLLGRMDSLGLLELRPREIIKVYLRKWFVVDLVCVVVDWLCTASVLGSVEVAVAALRTLVRWQRLRLNKVADVESGFGDRLRSQSSVLLGRVASMLGKLVLMAYVVCCMWFRLGVMESRGSQLGWVARRQLASEPLLQRLVISLHWALSLFNGEHVLDPLEYTFAELVFTLTFLFVFFIVSTFFVSSITTSLTRLQVISSQQQTEFASLRRYLSDRGISRELSARVTCNAKHAAVEQTRAATESGVALLKLISEPLLVELHFEVHNQVLGFHSFFRAYETVNPRGVRQLCHVAVSQQSVSKGDVVFCSLDTSEHRMLFVQCGLLHYIRSKQLDSPNSEAEHQETELVTEKQWAAEAALWTEWVHQGDLQAAGPATLLILDGQKFQDIVSPFPTGHPCDYAQRFVESLNVIDKLDLTDLHMPCQEDIAHAVFPEMFQRNSLSSGGSQLTRISRFSRAFRKSTVIIPDQP